MFADDQTDFLTSTCADFAKKNNSKTIVFQTGAWDLSYYNVRRTTEANETARKLLKVLTSILEGRLACPGLQHLVWLTSSPHAYCWQKMPEECNFHRGFRNNDAIAALNEFYMDGIFSANIKSDLKVSMIDVYGIIKPRLMFNEGAEVACLNHFECRAYERDGSLKILYAPGGRAVFETLLMSLMSHANV